MAAIAREPALVRILQTRGTATRIGAVINITPQGVWRWRRVPGEYVLQIEAALGISRHDMRPDLYPRDERSNRSRRQHGRSSRNHQKHV